LKDNPNVTIDARRSASQIKESLRRQGCTTQNKNGFQFQLRNREGYPGSLGENINIEQNTAEENIEPPSFELERPLREWLIYEISNNTIAINGRKVKLYKNSRDEYRTDVGNIDILTVDDEGNFYVFELKRNLGTHNAIGQVLSYMGWVQEHLANNREVKGVIVASDIDERLKAAVRVAPNIVLLKYKLHFELEKVS
jgi:hypothetical protein